MLATELACCHQSNSHLIVRRSTKWEIMLITNPVYTNTYLFFPPRSKWINGQKEARLTDIVNWNCRSFLRKILSWRKKTKVDIHPKANIVLNGRNNWNQRGEDKKSFTVSWSEGFDVYSHCSFSTVLPLSVFLVLSDCELVQWSRRV